MKDKSMSKHTERDEMIRDEFHNEVECDPDYLGWHNAHELADRLFDSVEKDTTCNGCKHKPPKDEVFPLECGECSRWYSDKYEEMK